MKAKKQGNPTSSPAKVDQSPKNILANLPEYVYWTNRQGALLGCNQGVLNYFGIESIDEIIGKTALEIGKLLKWQKGIAEALHKNNEEVIYTGIPKTTEETIFSTKGEKTVFLSHKAPLRDNKGKIIGMIGTSMNISTLKKNIEILEAEKQKAEKSGREIFNNLEQIVACMPGSIFWKDKNGIYQGCNDMLAKLFGVSKEEVVGRTDEYFGKKLGWTKDIAKAFAHIDQEVMDTGISRLNFEEPPFHFSDGRVFYQLVNKVPLRDEEGNVAGIVGIGIDISELKNTQALLKKEKERAEHLSKAKSEFIANMSHDVKTPLSGIIGVTNFLKERLTGEALSMTEDMLACAQQLMGFFNNCLEISKSEHVDLALIKERFSLKQLTEQMRELFRPAIENKKLTFTIDYDEKIPEILLGSQPAIYRILLNLTGNAIKFTNQGGITTHLSLSKRTTERQAIIKIVIQDTGIGIPKDKHKVIFEQFTRLTPSYQGIYEGTGLGLFVVNKLVKSLHGEMDLHSEEGKGSQFIVVLPLEIPLLDKSEYEKNHVKTTSPVTTGQFEIFNQPKTLPKILFIEDNPIAEQIVQVLLSPLGCKIDVVHSKQKALELFQPGKYQLVLIDTGLPNQESYTLAKQLRNLEKSSATDQVPIIGLSDQPIKNIIPDCKQVNMQGILNKPLSIEQAKQVFNRYVLKQPLIVEGLKVFE